MMVFEVCGTAFLWHQASVVVELHNAVEHRRDVDGASVHRCRFGA
jgi:hypothetical protein